MTVNAVSTTALARCVEETRLRLNDGVDEASSWVERVQWGALDPNECAICERKDGPFERHHVAGRLNSDLAVTVCLRCHRRLSERQNGWDPRWQIAEKSPDVEETFLLLGLSDVCEERARYFAPAYHELAKRLRAVYAKRARESTQ